MEMETDLSVSEKPYAETSWECAQWLADANHNIMLRQNKIRKWFMMFLELEKK